MGMRVWCDLLRDDYPSVHLLASAAWTPAFYNRMGLHNDGRAYAMIIRNDGSILWGSHDKFQEHLQEKEMVRAMQEEVEVRVEERQILLEQKKAEALEKSSGSEE